MLAVQVPLDLWEYGAAKYYEYSKHRAPKRFIDHSVRTACDTTAESMTDTLAGTPSLPGWNDRPREGLPALTIAAELSRENSSRKGTYPREVRCWAGAGTVHGQPHICTSEGG